MVKESDLNTAIYLMGLPASVQIRLLAFIFFPFSLPTSPLTGLERLAALAALASNTLTLSCATARPHLPRYHLSSFLATQLTWRLISTLSLSAASTGSLGATGAPDRTLHRRLSLQRYAICLLKFCSLSAALPVYTLWPH